MATVYEEALTHVAYECAALDSAYNTVFKATTTPPLIAALDSFLVHYRSLAEFLHASKDWPTKFSDDLRAEHYIPGWETPTLNEWMRWKPSIHILLAHLSTKRNMITTGFSHRVHFPPMREEINAAFVSFAQQLSGTIHQGKFELLLQMHWDNFNRIS